MTDCVRIKMKRRKIMKKFIVLLLIAAAFLTGCSSAEQETEAPDMNETESETETETETEAETYESVDTTNFYKLEAAGEPVFEDGILLVHFTEDDIRYTENSVFYIGIRGSGSAYTIKGESQIALYPELVTNSDKNYHSGVALIPSAEIPAGEYVMSVSFESFICEFDITIE